MELLSNLEDMSAAIDEMENACIKPSTDRHYCEDERRASLSIYTASYEFVASCLIDHENQVECKTTFQQVGIAAD